jgi:hypothetical protein
VRRLPPPRRRTRISHLTIKTCPLICEAFSMCGKRRILVMFLVDDPFASSRRDRRDVTCLSFVVAYLVRCKWGNRRTRTVASSVYRILEQSIDLMMFGNGKSTKPYVIRYSPRYAWHVCPATCSCNIWT